MALRCLRSVVSSGFCRCHGNRFSRPSCVGWVPLGDPGVRVLDVLRATDTTQQPPLPWQPTLLIQPAQPGGGAVVFRPCQRHTTKKPSIVSSGRLKPAPLLAGHKALFYFETSKMSMTLPLASGLRLRRPGVPARVPACRCHDRCLNAVAMGKKSTTSCAGGAVFALTGKTLMESATDTPRPPLLEKKQPRFVTPRVPTPLLEKKMSRSTTAGATDPLLEKQ